MKNKQSKSSVFYKSTKNKNRNQEKLVNFHNQSKDICAKASNSGLFSKNETNKSRMGDFFTEHHHSMQNHNNGSTRHLFSHFFSDDGIPNVDGSGHTYKKKGEKRTYLYGFTDSKFIYFLGTLKPRAYLIFVTLIGLLLTEDLNETESKIIFFFISNVADTMQTIVEQEVVLNSYNLKKFQREQGDALQKDFDTLYAQIDQLKREISYLKS